MRTIIIPSTRRAQRGASLFEALVAFLVLSLGMVAIARLQGHLRLDADVARQRSEAVRLAQLEIESLRSVRDIATLAPAARSVGTGTMYALERRIEPTGMPQARAASVHVAWTDRSGVRQSVALHAILGGFDPVLSAALALRAAEVASSPR